MLNSRDTNQPVNPISRIQDVVRANQLTKFEDYYMAEGDYVILLYNFTLATGHFAMKFSGHALETGLHVIKWDDYDIATGNFVTSIA